MTIDTCKIIHKKCHLRSQHSDIKYHMTFNTVSSVVAGSSMFHWFYHCHWQVRLVHTHQEESGEESEVECHATHQFSR